MPERVKISVAFECGEDSFEAALRQLLGRDEGVEEALVEGARLLGGDGRGGVSVNERTVGGPFPHTGVSLITPKYQADNTQGHGAWPNDRSSAATPP
jgi:hypothetical protein